VENVVIATMTLAAALLLQDPVDSALLPPGSVSSALLQQRSVRSDLLPGRSPSQPAQGPVASAATVTGQIHTRDGVPAAAVRVSAIPAPPPDARPQDGSQYYEAPPPVSSVLTNNQGLYRLANLPRGRYLIVAGILGQGTYHPSTMDAAAATVVTVGPGAAPTGIDIKLAMPYGGRVTGRVNPPPAADVREIAVLSGLTLAELLEVPVGPNGTFEFGHVPRGAYLLSLFPTPPGMASLPFQVGDNDVTPLMLARRPVHAVTGRIVVPNGPLPAALLAFVTPTSHVQATVKPDGSFVAHLHAARHATDLGGLPVGYSIASIRLGGADVSAGFVVSDADLSGLVITLDAPNSGR
jgi:hypothetical protein